MFFFFKQKTAYESEWGVEFRHVLFPSGGVTTKSMHTPKNGSLGPNWGEKENIT